MHTEINNALSVADKGTQYDESAKRLLGQKSILAHILVKTVAEFKGISSKEVIPLIEGTPYISSVPVEPGLTNKEKQSEPADKEKEKQQWQHKKGGQRVVGMDSENMEYNEGLVRFDIVFYVSRLISSQKERDFENMQYDDIKRVYSIWVCMNMGENSLSHVRLVKEDLIGYHNWRGKLDLFNVVLIGLSKELPEQGGTV